MRVVDILLLCASDHFHFEFLTRAGNHTPDYWGKLDVPYNQEIRVVKPDASPNGVTQAGFEFTPDTFITLQTFYNGNGVLRMRGLNDVGRHYQNDMTVYMSAELLKALYRALLIFAKEATVYRLKVQLRIRDDLTGTIKVVVD